jgi:hypothetical protein
MRKTYVSFRLKFKRLGDFSKRVFFDILFKQCFHKTIEKKPTIVFGKKEVVTLQLIV